MMYFVPIVAGITSPIVTLIIQAVVGAAFYLGVNHLLHSKIQADAIAYFRGRL